VPEPVGDADSIDRAVRNNPTLNRMSAEATALV
jgi:hypothetical protein